MDLEQTLNEARRKVLSGTPLSIEEQAELLRVIRGNRFAAAEAGAASRTRKTAAKTAKTGLSDDDLDSQLGDLGL